MDIALFEEVISRDLMTSLEEECGVWDHVGDTLLFVGQHLRPDDAKPPVAEPLTNVPWFRKHSCEGRRQETCTALAAKACGRPLGARQPIM